MKINTKMKMIFFKFKWCCDFFFLKKWCCTLIIKEMFERVKIKFLNPFYYVYIKIDWIKKKSEHTKIKWKEYKFTVLIILSKYINYFIKNVFLQMIACQPAIILKININKIISYLFTILVQGFILEKKNSYNTQSKSRI